MNSVRAAIALIALMFGAAQVLAAPLQNDDDEHYLVTRFTYLPGGLVHVSQRIETVTGPNAFAGLSFIDTRDFVPVRTVEDMNNRKQQAAELEALGYHADWRKFSQANLVNIIMRVRKANALREVGVDVSWDKYQAWELIEIEHGYRINQQLELLGVTVKWREMTLSDLTDVLSRVTKARELAAKGLKVDWKRTSLEQMHEIDAKASRRDR
jgi:hypothetical protein